MEFENLNIGEHKITISTDVSLSDSFMVAAFWLMNPLSSWCQETGNFCEECNAISHSWERFSALGKRDGRIPQFMVVIWDKMNYGRLWQ